jgi:hypothetical protein
MIVNNIDSKLNAIIAYIAAARSPRKMAPRFDWMLADMVERWEGRG